MSEGYDWELDEDEQAPQFRAPRTVRIGFDCGHVITWLASRMIPAECPDCAANVQPNGRCEDWPCCGHTLEDGCGFSPTHTSDYWHEWISARQAQGFDLDDPDFYPWEED